MAFRGDIDLVKELKINNSKIKVLDIGCSSGKLEDAIGLDIRMHPGVDVIADFNSPCPIRSDSFELILVNNILEHVENVVNAMQEIHRIGKKKSWVVIRTPHFSHPESFRDPTHRWHFTWETFDYFIEGDSKSGLYSDVRFKYIKKELLFGKGLTGRIGNLLSKLSIRRYEKYHCKPYPSNGLYCILETIK